jgi:hypothetical protein
LFSARASHSARLKFAMSLTFGEIGSAFLRLDLFQDSSCMSRFNRHYMLF